VGKCEISLIRVLGGFKEFVAITWEMFLAFKGKIWK